MTKKELLARIEWLERRVIEIERRPVIVAPQPIPYLPEWPTPTEPFWWRPIVTSTNGTAPCTV